MGNDQGGKTVPCFNEQGLISGSRFVPEKAVYQSTHVLTHLKFVFRQYRRKILVKNGIYDVFYKLNPSGELCIEQLYES